VKDNELMNVVGHLGEPVKADGWTMTLVGEWRDVKFLGLTPEGQFVQVDLHFRALQPGQSLTLNFPQDAALLTPDGREIPMKGIPFEHDERRTLIVGQPAVKFAGEATFALILTFDVPADEKEFALRVKNFPLVKVTLFSTLFE
jgi:hypothetical protein